jgi:hypothetical protein
MLHVSTRLSVTCPADYQLQTGLFSGTAELQGMLLHQVHERSELRIRVAHFRLTLSPFETVNSERGHAWITTTHSPGKFPKTSMEHTSQSTSTPSDLCANTVVRRL